MSFAQRVQLSLCALVMAGVLSASISGLAKVAELVVMPVVTLPSPNGGAPFAIPVGTIGLILAWDGMQLCAGWAVHTARTKGALVILVLTATASGAAQGWAGVLEKVAQQPDVSWWVLAVVAAVHASPAVFLIGAEYLTLTSSHRRTKQSGGAATAPPRKKAAAPKAAPARPSAGGRAGAAPTTQPAPAPPAPAPEPLPSRSRTGSDWDEMLDAARSIQAAAPARLGRDAMYDALKTLKDDEGNQRFKLGKPKAKEIVDTLDAEAEAEPAAPALHVVGEAAQ